MPRFRQSRVTPETSIKQAIKHYLGIMGWWCVPILQGLGSYKGIPDLIALKAGRVLFLEVKAEKGRQSEYQVEFQRKVEATGNRYAVVRSTYDVERVIGEMEGKI